jgi:hypothetical protein
MRRFFILPALTLVAAALLARADDAKKSDMDPKALDILKKASAVFKDMKSMHVEASIVADISTEDVKKQTKTEAVYDMEAPNRFAFRTKIDGKADAGTDIVCDGKKMFTYAKGAKQYTEEEAVKSLADIGGSLQQAGMPNTGLLFANVLTEDPYDSLMMGVTEASYAGTEKVNGTEAHHLKFVQPGLKWELWIATTGKPLVLKGLSVLESDNGKAKVVETYQNYKVDGEPAKDAFNFKPDGESKKVNTITDNKS